MWFSAPPRFFAIQQKLLHKVAQRLRGVLQIKFRLMLLYNPLSFLCIFANLII